MMSIPVSKSSQGQFLSPTSVGWAPMWEALCDAAGSYGDCNPENGECWQYMGTHGGCHQFRHRDRPRGCRPISGFAGQGDHVERVYLHMDAETLEVRRVIVKRYTNPIAGDVPAGLTTADAISRARRESQRIEYPDHVPMRGDYGGAFDGIRVTSDADPGL